MLKKIGEIATEVTMTVKEATYGNACLVMGHGTLKRASDAGVTPEQMKAIFPDLEPYTPEHINGFIQIGTALVTGAVSIPSTVFSQPEWKPVQTGQSNQG